MENVIEETPKNTKFFRFIQKIKYGWLKIWSSKLLTFGLLFLVIAILSIIIFSIAEYRGGYFNINSDDVLQYYPYISGLFTKIKNHTLSLYDTTLYGGTSIFGSVYYLPFDIFTLLTYLLSYFVQAETAYSIANFLKPACGAFLLYYFFVRKGFSTKAAFVSAVAYMIGGVTEAYYIFPVYLGINFYAPLVMIIIDLCIEKKGTYYFLLPLYSIAVILYDFYMGYMLLAFACVFFVIEMHITDNYSFFGKNTIFKNKEYWIRFFEFLFFLIAGVIMTSFFLLPSALYVLNESSRQGSIYGYDSVWYYYANHSATDGHYGIYYRHYFTQFCNLFIPNEPHRFCLNDAGDYMREHASFYITSGGLVYLAYFFFINGKRENKLKFWVVLFNIMFAMPIFAKIFCFNEIPYSRWFFIPYLINLYAATIAMNHNDFKLSNKWYINIFPLLFMLIGMGTLIFVMITGTDLFIHYRMTNGYFYPILIGSIVCISIYSIFMILNMIFTNKNHRRISRLFRTIMPVLIFLESIFAGVIIFSNAFNASSSYFSYKNELVYLKTQIETPSDKDEGFDPTAGYRINMYTFSGKGTANANILVGDVNFGRFFQSFYNTPLTTCMSNIYHDNFNNSWSRCFNNGYGLLSSNIFNVKYVVTQGNTLNFPKKYYEEIKNDGTFYYYKYKNINPFIVYDKMVDGIDSSNYALGEATPLFYGYTPDVLTAPSSDASNYEQTYNDFITRQRYVDYGFEFYSKSNASDTLEEFFTTEDYLSTESTVHIDDSDYYKFELKNRAYKDVLQVYPSNDKIRREPYERMIVEDADGIRYESHYNTFFINNINMKYVYVRKVDDTKYASIKVSSYSYDLVDKFYEEQNQYTDKEFTLNGSTMTIKCTMPDDSKVRVIKTGYTYSNDWKIKTEGYETINIDGGFLGIVVKQGIKDVDITLKYEPAGYKVGLVLSLLACLGMGLIGGITLYVMLKKRKGIEVISKKKKESLSEIIRFLVVGGVATLCDYIIFYLANLLILKALPANINLAISTVLGFTAGLIVNWLLQRFVFKYVSEQQTKSKKVFAKFVILSLIGLGLTELGMLLSQPLYGKVVITVKVTFDLIKLLMKILMTCIVLVFNYIGRKVFVFAERKPKEDTSLNDNIITDEISSTTEDTTNDASIESLDSE